MLARLLLLNSLVIVRRASRLLDSRVCARGQMRDFQNAGARGSGPGGQNFEFPCFVHLFNSIRSNKTTTL